MSAGPVVDAAAKVLGPDVTAWPQPEGVPRAVMVPVPPVALAIAFPLAGPTNHHSSCQRTVGTLANSLLLLA